MIPGCYNREPRQPHQFRHGFDQQTGEPITVTMSNAWFTDRCATHDGRGIAPNGENYPDAHGWECTGCRWDPRTEARERRDA